MVPAVIEPADRGGARRGVLDQPDPPETVPGPWCRERSPRRRPWTGTRPSRRSGASARGTRRNRGRSRSAPRPDACPPVAARRRHRAWSSSRTGPEVPRMHTVNCRSGRGARRDGAGRSCRQTWPRSAGRWGRPGRPLPSPPDFRPSSEADFTSTRRLAPRRVASQQARLSEVTSQLAAISGSRPAIRQGSQIAARAARSSGSGLREAQPRLQCMQGQTKLLHRQDCHAMRGEIVDSRRPGWRRAHGDRRTARRPGPRSAAAPAMSPAPPSGRAARGRIVQAAAELDDPHRRLPERRASDMGRQAMRHRLVKLLGGAAPWLMGVVNVTPELVQRRRPASGAGCGYRAWPPADGGRRPSARPRR